MIEFIYSIINVLITPFLLMNLVYRCLISKEDYTRVKERLGIASKIRPSGKLVWIHTASVGESMSVSTLVDQLNAAGYNILLTTYTKASAKIVKKEYAKKVTHQFIPLENLFFIKQFLSFWKPDLAIFVESEFWPMIICQSSKSTKLISLNTKISDRSFKRWKKLKPFVSEILNKFSVFYPQDRQAEERLRYIGVRKVERFGNLKYSSRPLHVNAKFKSELKKQLGVRDAILAFSTHEGEEEKIIQAYKSVLKVRNDLLLIIAPRHVVRSLDIQDLVKISGLKCSVRSKNENITKDTNVFLADTMGELGTLFDVVKINIVGGSLNKTIGGHNPIEPAKLSSMCLMGPENHGFREITQDFMHHDAIVRFSDVSSLEKELLRLLDNPSLVKKYSNNAFRLVDKVSGSHAMLFKKIIENLK